MKRDEMWTAAERLFKEIMAEKFPKVHREKDRFMKPKNIQNN